MRKQRSDWNKGRLLAQKPPLKPKEIWSLRIRLQLAGKARNLALFNLAIDSKLRGCDLVSLRVRDVYQGSLGRGSHSALSGHALRQHCVGHPDKAGDVRPVDVAYAAVCSPPVLHARSVNALHDL